MLSLLRIRNLAIIDNAEMRFATGLNIISGETGAGKSIVINAISLLLGSRASSDLVRLGCAEALVEGLFDTAQLHWVQERLLKLGFQDNGPELLVKRIIHGEGRHRIYVNGELCTLGTLQQLCDGIVELCGQHEHQSLLKSGVQLDLLDRYGGVTEKTKEFQNNFAELKSLDDSRNRLIDAQANRAKRKDFLRFQISELRSAGLREGEDSELNAEKQLLQSAQARGNTAQSVTLILDGEDSGALACLKSALLKARQLSQMDPHATVISEAVERALAETEDASASLGKYLNTIEINEERSLAVQERLSLIGDLRRKYGQEIADMLLTLSTLETELAELEDAEDSLSQLAAKHEKALGIVKQLGSRLSNSRQKAAKLFSDSVTVELRELNMADARFNVEVSPEGDAEKWNNTGADSIQYLVKTNKGEEAKPLAKIASGGELSRLMLAIRRVIMDRGGIGVYLFDEIDAGIGGKTAFQVGKKLKSVAGFNQVICITHLPQVAAFADHHLVVSKTTSGKRTTTEVTELSADERKRELARMLGGAEVTASSLANAKELLGMSGAV